MIIKKLYRRIKCRWWNKNLKEFEDTTITDYVGWFLFGFIPVYLIELDKYEDICFESGKDTLKYGVIEKYKHLMVK